MRRSENDIIDEDFQCGYLWSHYQTNGSFSPSTPTQYAQNSMQSEQPKLLGPPSSPREVLFYANSSLETNSVQNAAQPVQPKPPSPSSSVKAVLFDANSIMDTNKSIRSGKEETFGNIGSFKWSPKFSAVESALVEDLKDKVSSSTSPYPMSSFYRKDLVPVNQNIAAGDLKITNNREAFQTSQLKSAIKKNDLMNSDVSNSLKKSK